MRLTAVFFAAAALGAALPSKAAVFTEAGSLVSSGEYRIFGQNVSGPGAYYELLYSFQPVSIVGQITSISAAFNGSVVPGVLPAGPTQTGNVTLTPHVTIVNGASGAG